jgi:hypothetical protein
VLLHTYVPSCVHQVTTKKGYDGCRKADYLYAHDAITDKTFANLGETTISNLKSNFDGVETGAQQHEPASGGRRALSGPSVARLRCSPCGGSHERQHVWHDLNPP